MTKEAEPPAAEAGDRLLTDEQAEAFVAAFRPFLERIWADPARRPVLERILRGAGSRDAKREE